MRKKPRPLDREARPVRDASLVVIASEDRYAVRQYFDFFESTRIQFRVLETQDGKSAPEHVFSRLDDYIAEFEIQEDDTFWLVCDCDHWIEPTHIGNLTRTLTACRQKGIRLAMSNPCFDLWLYLHFAEHPTESKLTCEEVGERLTAAVGNFDKKKVYNLPITDESVRVAIARAAANQPCKGDIPDRPQTAIHMIIQHLIARRIIHVRTAEVSEVPSARKTTSRKRR
jgi:hypothetical protein